MDQIPLSQQLFPADPPPLSKVHTNSLLSHIDLCHLNAVQACPVEPASSAKVSNPCFQCSHSHTKPPSTLIPQTILRRTLRMMRMMRTKFRQAQCSISVDIQFANSLSACSSNYLWSKQPGLCSKCPYHWSKQSCCCHHHPPCLPKQPHSLPHKVDLP